MTELPTLRAWLATLDAEHLQDLLERHPMVLAGARVRDLDEVASRLEHPVAVSDALGRAPTPVVEVLEAADALGAAATVSNLEALLDASGADADTHRDNVRRWLNGAASLALSWIDGDQVRINPGVHEIVLCPLALGGPAQVSLASLTSDDLARILGAWHRSTPPRKAERVAAATELFADLPAIRRLAGTSPDDVLETINSHVTERLSGAHSVIVEAFAGAPDQDGDEVLGRSYFDPDTYRAHQQAWQWALSAGLATGRGTYSYGYGGTIDLHSEVYLALAPASFRAPFHPDPPPLPLVDASAEQVDRTSGAAAGQFLGTAMAILEAVGRDGIAQLQSGGVGFRELGRYAKAIGTDVATVRVTLTLAARLELIDARSRSRLGTTPEFQTWRRLPPERRAADLLLAWMSPGAIATLDRDADGSYLPALADLGDGSGVPIGYLLARTLVDNPGRAAVSADDLLQWLLWSFPRAGTPRGALSCLWSEAHLLGILADGAVSRFADALCQGDDARAIEVLERLLPAQSRQVLFGSDLTIVIAGNPMPEVVDVLDVVARREGHGVANTWRVSEQSLRDALDAGYPMDDLTAALRWVADGELPQALDYLMRDVARRYGHLTVRPAAAIVTSTDAALLAEMAGTRRLRKLGLELAAPTVAVANARVPVLLRELRAAGYLPVEMDGDGVPTLELRRMPVPGSGGAATDEAVDDAAGDPVGEAAGEPVGDDAVGDESDGDGWEEMPGTLDELLRLVDGQPQTGAPSPPETPAVAARRLLSGTDDAPPPSDLEVSIAHQNRRLSPAEVHELADAVSTGRGVQIGYLTQSGGETQRVVTDLTVLGPNLYGYCHLRQAERNFRLDRILSVAPLLS